MDATYFKSRQFLVPSLLWVLFLAVFLMLFATGERMYLSLDAALIQWDGDHYLSIARSGYEKFPCPFNADYICGNIGWFPFYPLLSRAVGWMVGIFGVDIRWSLLLTGWLSLWLALLLLYRLIEGRFGAKAALFSLIVLLVFPSSFYFLTGFPYALYLLLAVLVFFALERERYWLAVLPSGLLAVTYPSGIVIGLPLLLTLFVRCGKLQAGHRAALLAALGAIGIALLVFASYYWWRFDDFFLFQKFQAQRYYAHELTFPLLPIIDTFGSLDFSNPVFAMLLLLVLTLLLFYTRKIPATWQVFMFGVLLFTPTLGTTTCYYRHMVVAFPLYAMIGVAGATSWRRYLLLPYAIAALTLIWWVYLPAFEAGQLM